MIFRASRRPRLSGNSNKVDILGPKVQNCGGVSENRPEGGETKRSTVGCALRAVMVVICILSTQAAAFAADVLWLESLKSDLNEFPDRFVEDSRDTFLKTDNLVALLVAGGATVVMHEGGADESIAEHFAGDSDFADFWDETLSVVGSPAMHFPATAIWYAISAQNGDELGKERAWTMMTALSVNGAVTFGLKAIRHNGTPNGDGWSWPSGHASSSFTVASVLHEYYGLKVGVPAYILAAVVAYRMMDAGDHWGSDIVFGGTLGLVVGHTIGGKHKNLKVAGFRVLPYLSGEDEPAVGVGFARTF